VENPVSCIPDFNKPLEVEVLVARKIVLKHPRSRCEIALVATEEGAGIWIGDSDNKGDLISIYSLNGNTAVGLYGKNKDHGCAVALSVDRDGSPVAQLVSPSGETIILGFDELKKIAGK
jgi:hypothetical protein